MSAKKNQYSIGEVAKLVAVETHTIRFWSNEFENDIPFSVKAGGRRYYNDQSIVVLNKIKDLIHNKGIKIRSIKSQDLINKVDTFDRSENIDLHGLLMSLINIRSKMNKSLRELESYAH